MKNVVLCCLMAISFMFSACSKNPCKDVSCGDHGICNGANGECVCLDSYTKDADGKCTVAPVVATLRSPYLGTYLVTEQGVGAASSPFTVSINAGAGEDDVILVGHGGYKCGATMELVSLQGVANPSGLYFSSYQRYCGSSYDYFDNFSVPAILNSTFSVNYGVNENGTYTKNVTATFVKQ